MNETAEQISKEPEVREALDQTNSGLSHTPYY